MEYTNAIIALFEILCEYVNDNVILCILIVIAVVVLVFIIVRCVIKLRAIKLKEIKENNRHIEKLIKHFRSDKDNNK